jgi:hypothetical protein
MRKKIPFCGWCHVKLLHFCVKFLQQKAGYPYPLTRFSKWAVLAAFSVQWLTLGYLTFPCPFKTFLGKVFQLLLRSHLEGNVHEQNSFCAHNKRR